MKNWIFEDSKVYDFLKWLAAPVLPAVATLLIGASQIWDIPILALVGATITLVATCLGEITHVSSQKYWASQPTGGDYSKEEEDGNISESDDQ